MNETSPRPSHRSVMGIFRDRAFFPDQIFCSPDLIDRSMEACHPSFLTAGDLEKQEIPAKIDILVWPYGGYFPVQAFDVLRRFLGRGGHIMVLGGAPFWFPCSFRDGKWQRQGNGEMYPVSDMWLSPFAGRMGISAWAVYERSAVGSDPPSFEVVDEFAGHFKTARRLPCRRFYASLFPRDAGRRIVVARAVKGASPAPQVTEFVTLVEPAGDPEINGKILHAGLAPASDWSDQNTIDFLHGLVKILELDAENSLGIGIRLSAGVIRQGESLTCRAWPRSSRGRSEKFTCRLVSSDTSKVFGQADVKFKSNSDSPTEVSLPTQSLPGGGYSVMVREDENETFSLSFSVLDPPGALPPMVRARRINGYAAFEIDGKPIPALDYCFIESDRALDRLVGDFGRAGVHVFTVNYNLGRGWKGEGQFDWTEFDELAGRIFRQDPQGYLYARIYLGTPEWWNRRYSDQLRHFRRGLSGTEDFREPDKEKVPSWASTQWREDTRQLLTSFISHVQSGVYGSRMFGYFYMHGQCGEWGEISPDGGFTWEDLSDPALQAFRAWLRKRYPNEADRAKKWEQLRNFTMDQVRLPKSDYMIKSNPKHHFLDDHDKVASMAADIGPARIDQAIPPNAIRRRIGRYGILRDPAPTWDVIEFFRFYQDLFAQTIAYFARAIKEISAGRALVGTFGGYLLQEYLNEADDGYQQFVFSRILAEDNKLDVVTNPYNYYRRENATGDSNCRAVHGSINLSEKVFVDENDERTCLSDLENRKWYGTLKDTLEGTAEAVKRNFILRLTRGAGLWWFDFGLGWYDHPRIMETIGQCRRIHERALKEPNPFPMANHMDVLNIIYSLRVYDYACPSSRFFRCNTSICVQRHFNRSGFPWEVYLTNDMPKVPRRRAYLFLNTFVLEPREREFIEKNLKKDGNILIWIYAPGLYENETPAIENCSRLTGIKLGWDANGQDIRIKIKDTAHPVVSGLKDMDLSDFGSVIDDDPDSVGPLGIISPQIYCVDSQATALGTIEATGTTGFAVRDFGTWKSVFISSPIVPAPVMRNLLTWAGLNPVLDTDDALYTNGDFIGIHAKQAGDKIISFREEFELEDLFADRRLTSAGGKVKLFLETGQTFVGRVRRRL
jgi:hypothetical protein